MRQTAEHACAPFFVDEPKQFARNRDGTRTRWSKHLPLTIEETRTRKRARAAFALRELGLRWDDIGAIIKDNHAGDRAVSGQRAYQLAKQWERMRMFLQANDRAAGLLQFAHDTYRCGGLAGYLDISVEMLHEMRDGEPAVMQRRTRDAVVSWVMDDHIGLYRLRPRSGEDVSDELLTEHINRSRGTNDG